MKNTDSNNKVKDLIIDMTNAPNQYTHLQIFLSRAGKIGSHIDSEFLMVTPSTFEKVKVLDLMY